MACGVLRQMVTALLILVAEETDKLTCMKKSMIDGKGYMLTYEHGARLLNYVIAAGAVDGRNEWLLGQASILSQRLGLSLVSPYSTYLHSIIILDHQSIIFVLVR